MPPLISIITVVYNGVDGIEATLRSIFSQDPSLYEVVVIDGGSTDGTLDILDHYRDRFAVCISEPDRGIYDAMNKGISHARCEWLYFLNCGDCFVDSEVLTKASRHLTNTKAPLVIGRVNYMSEGRVIRQIPGRMPSKITARRLFRTHLCHQAMFTRRSCCIAVGSFDTRLPTFSDFNTSYKVIQDSGVFERIELLIANFDGSGLSSDSRRAVQLYCEAEAMFTLLGESRSRLEFVVGYLRAWLYQRRMRVVGA